MNLKKTFTPKKSLGQNFLVNEHIAKKIIDACNLAPSDNVLEIGPGKGALTQMLSSRCKHVHAIEKDKILFQKLQKTFNHTNVDIIHADILKFPIESIPKNSIIIGNLPYNITTPIIKKIIDHRSQIKNVFITVQLEFGQRMIAAPNTKNYGSFSCFAQFHTIAKILFKIKNSAFKPAPKVQSCFMHLKILEKPAFQVADEGALFKIIRSCFSQRRKTIHNSISGAIKKPAIPSLLQACQIDPKKRAENLAINDYVRITNEAYKLGLIKRGKY